MGFYSCVEPNSFTCRTSLFLMGRILINGRIFQNPPRARILITLGLYEVGLIVCRKYFPFWVSWKLHIDKLGTTRPFDPSTLCTSTRDSSIIRTFAQHRQVHLEFGPSCLIFPLQLPFSPHGVVIFEWKGLWGDNSIWILRNSFVLVRLAKNHLWHRTCGIQQLVVLLDRSVPSSFVPSLYINQFSSSHSFIFS